MQREALLTISLTGFDFDLEADEDDEFFNAIVRGGAGAGAANGGGDTSELVIDKWG